MPAGGKVHHVRQLYIMRHNNAHLYNNHSLPGSPQEILHSPHIVLLPEMTTPPAQPPVEASLMVSEGQQVMVPEGGSQQLA